MEQTTILTVRNEDLGRLSSDGAVTFFAKLLWADARRLGLSVTLVNISSRTNVADGGVDADITATVPDNNVLILIKNGRSVYQVKTGGFEPWKEGAIYAELFGPKPKKDKKTGTTAPWAQRNALGAPVRECLDLGGRYVLVCTGADLTSEQRSKSVSLLKNALKESGYPRAEAEVLSQNQLLGILKSFPSLSLELNGHTSSPFYMYEGWSLQDQMRLPLKLGQAQTEWLKKVSETIRGHEQAVHCHVRGEPGIGKTRLVLEALREPDLKPMVIYCEKPHEILDSLLIYEVGRSDNSYSMILVVDECDIESRARLWNRLKHLGQRLKLITIYGHFEQQSGNTLHFNVPPLEKDQIEEILKEYLPAQESASRWAEFCSGSPRVAHVVGLNLKENPEDLLRSPDTVSVWDRYIVGTEPVGSIELQQRQTVLRRLALFKRFGFGPAVVNEAKAIAALCAQDDPSISWSRFEDIIQDLRDRKILQGESTLYITPKLLHIKLWVDWWNRHGGSFVFDEFVAALPNTLLDWFLEMSRYAESSQAAKRVFRDILGANGPFQASGLLFKDRGGQFFMSLTEAAPAEALQFLNNTIGQCNRDDLLKFTCGRRHVVEALERIAIWRDLFADAARLLFKLAQAENESWSNNSTGIFTQLFSPGQGPVAPTEASPAERFPVLMEAVSHKSKEGRAIGLLACQEALRTHHISRVIGAEYQGLKRQPQLWKAETWGELFNAYRQVWVLLEKSLESFDRDDRSQACEVLLQSARGVASYANLAPMVIQTLTDLAYTSWADQKKIIQVVETVLHFDAKTMESSIRAKWSELREALVTNDFHSLMQRYVAMDLLEDKIDGDDHRADKAKAKIEYLAAQAIANPELLRSELPWLITDQAKNGFRFGFELGRLDESLSQLPSLLEAQGRSEVNPTALLLGGYLRALRNRDEIRWERTLSDIAESEELRSNFAELVWRSGLTDHTAAQLLELLKDQRIPVSSLSFFQYGGDIRDLSPGRLEEWIAFLLECGTAAAVTNALDFVSVYYLRSEPKRDLPRDLAFDVLTAPALFEATDQWISSTMDDYRWAKVATAYITQHPERAIELGKLMVDHFREAGTILGAFKSQTFEVLTKIIERSPGPMWSYIGERIAGKVDVKSFELTHWLREGSIRMIPAEDVWRWVDEDEAVRARTVAELVAPVFPGETTSASAREVLVRYGGSNKVLSALWANFSTETWWGPESQHAQQKLEEIERWRQGEQDANVLRWLNEFRKSLLERIEAAKVIEERHFG